MGNVLENLSTATMSLTGENIDPRYFKDNGDGTYTPTPALIHNIIRDSMNFYKEQIFSQDTECMYHTEKLSEFKDTWKEKQINDKREQQYGEQLKELEKRKRDWRMANPDKCDTRSGGPDLGDKDEKRFFAGYSPEIKPSLNNAVALYKFLKEYDTANGEAIKEAIPTMPEVLMVKSEYANEYKELCNKWAEELGIPMVTEEVGKVTRTKYTIAQLRNANMKAVASTDDGLQEYIDGLIKYITSSNKVEYKKKRQECNIFVDKDFIVEFNDTVKDLKADVLSDNSIVIYTKMTEDTDAVKFITISKENPTDNYKYVMSIDTGDEHLRYTKNISTKADIRKALEVSISMIEGTVFEKYREDLDKFIEAL